MADNKKSSISRRSTCYLLNLKAPEKTAKRLKLSFQRTAATVKLMKAEREVEASIGFLDVSETGAGVFTPELLHKGAVVELSIIEPVFMRVRGIVAWSIPVTSGIHAGKYRCRSGIQFVFENETQAQSLRNFVARSGQDPIENIRNSKPPVSAAEAAAMASMAGVVDPTSAPPVVGLDAVVDPVAAPVAPVEAPAAVVEAPAAVVEAPAAAAEAVVEAPVVTEVPKAA